MVKKTGIFLGSFLGSLLLFAGIALASGGGGYGPGGSGITTLNTLTAQVQTFANGTSGTAPAFSSSSSTHTLNIPMAATAAVTAGLLSKTQYDLFNGTTAINRGGTGATTKAAAFDALSPMSASGDLVYGGVSGTGTRLAKGSDGQVLTLASGLPTWADAAGGGNFRKTLYTDTTLHSNTTSGLVTFSTYTMPGGTLANDGESLLVHAYGLIGNVTADTEKINCTVGGTSVNGFIPRLYDGDTWDMQMWVVRNGATSQVGNFILSSSHGTGDIQTYIYTAAETLSGNVDITCNCTTTSATADQCDQFNFTVEFIPKQ